MTRRHPPRQKGLRRGLRYLPEKYRQSQHPAKIPPVPVEQTLSDPLKQDFENQQPNKCMIVWLVLPTRRSRLTSDVLWTKE